MEAITIRKATPNDAEAACAVLVRSIKGICAPYYENDKEILTQWLENKTLDNVRQWIESDRSYCVVAVDGKDLVVAFANISGPRSCSTMFCPKRYIKVSENECFKR